MILFHLVAISSSVPTGCVPGITRTLWYPYTRNTIAMDSGRFWGGVSHNDFGFFGSFCPHVSARYRIIVDGTYSYSYENKWSSYVFHNVTTKSRTTPFIYLSQGACYQYLLLSSTGNSNSNGLFYIEMEGSPMTLLTSDKSYSCQKSFCLNNDLSFPNCSDQYTKQFSSRISWFFLLIHSFIQLF